MDISKLRKGRYYSLKFFRDGRLELAVLKVEQLDLKNSTVDGPVLTEKGLIPLFSQIPCQAVESGIYCLGINYPWFPNEVLMLKDFVKQNYPGRAAETDKFLKEGWELEDDGFIKLLLVMVLMALPSIFTSFQLDKPEFFRIHKYWRVLFYIFFFFMVLGIVRC